MCSLDLVAERPLFISRPHYLLISFNNTLLLVSPVTPAEIQLHFLSAIRKLYYNGIKEIS